MEITISGTDTRRVGGELYQGLIQEGVESTISGMDTRNWGWNYTKAEEGRIFWMNTRRERVGGGGGTMKDIYFRKELRKEAK